MYAYKMTSRLMYALSPADKHKFLGTSTLPTEFIKYLRTLFEMLDKGNNGYIKISDLEGYWGSEYQLDESTSNSLIIKILYEIAPGNAGLLSFPRLCTGIKEALLQVKVHKQRPKSFICALDLDNDVDFEDERGDSLFRVPMVSSSSSSVRRQDNTADIRPDLSAITSRSIDKYSQKKISHKNTGNLIAYGLQMIDKIKWWYSRQSSHYYYDSEVNDLPVQELSKIEQVNNQLENILRFQSLKNGYVQGDSKPNQTEIIKEQEAKIAQLEGEKSLLIRELFQLKAQHRSPASKRNFPLFN